MPLGGVGEPGGAGDRAGLDERDLRRTGKRIRRLPLRDQLSV